MIRVTVPPVDGAANDAAIEALADFLHVPRGRLTIAAGSRGRSKTVLIEGLTAGEVRSTIEGRLPSQP